MPEIDRHASAAGPAYRDSPAVRATHESPRFEDELDLGRHLRIFTRHPLLLLAGALLGALAGLLVAANRPAVYEAVTTLIAHLPARQGAAGADRASLRAFLENQTLATQVLEELELHKPPSGLTAQSFAAQALRVEEPAGTNLLRVRVQLQDPRLAMEASRRLSHKAVSLNRRVASEAGNVLRTELKPRLDEATERLKAASDELVAYQREAQIELLEADSRALVEDREELFDLLAQIEGEKARLASAEAELRRRQPLLTADRAPQAEEALRRAASPPAERERPSTRQERPSADRDERRPGDPAGAPRTDPARGETAKPANDETARAARKPAPEDVDRTPRRSAAQEIDRTAADPESLNLTDPRVNPVYQTLDLQVATSRSRLAALEQQRQQLSRRAGGTQLKELTTLYQRKVELARRQNDYDVAQRVFEEVSLRFERSRADLMGASAYLQVIDEAATPDRPMPRKRLQTIVLGMLAGLFAGALAAVVLESRAASGARS